MIKQRIEDSLVRQIYICMPVGQHWYKERMIHPQSRPREAAPPCNIRSRRQSKDSFMRNTINSVHRRVISEKVLGEKEYYKQRNATEQSTAILPSIAILATICGSSFLGLTTAF